MNYDLEGKNGSCSARDIEAVQKQVGRLPAEYVAFLRQTNGGKAGLVFEKPGLFVEIVDFNSCAALPGEAELFSDRLRTKKFLPIASSTSGDRICVTIGSGAIVWWDHDLGGPSEVIVLAAGFEAFWQMLKPRIWETRYDAENWRSLPRNWKNDGGNSICECAAIEGHDAVVKVCLAEGYPFGQAMHYAAQNGHMRIVDLLIGHGVSINSRNKNRKTPLDCAAWNPKNVAPLRERGALRSTELK